MFSLNLALGGSAITGGRGLVYDPLAYGLRPGVIDVITTVVASALYTQVAPGRDTEVTIGVDGLVRNADVKRFTLRLLVGDGPAGTDAVTSMSIKGPTDAEPKGWEIAVAPPTRPRNLTLRLDGGEVFWRKGDVLAEDEYGLPDIASEVNAYLDRLPASGDVALRFLVTSDTPGAVRLMRGDFSATRIQTQTWTNPVDGAKTVDRSIALTFGETADLELLPLPDDGSAGRAIALTIDVSGAFDPDRSLGNAVLSMAGEEFATVGGDFALAQAVRPAVNARCTGVTVVATSDAAATLYVALVPDADGAPGDGPPLAEAQLAVTADPKGPTAWRYVAWQAPVELAAGARVWLLIRGIQGNVLLPVAAIADEFLDAMLISRGGQVWRPLTGDAPDGTRAHVRLVYLPGAENPSSAVVLVVHDRVDDSEILSIPADAGDQPRTMRIAMPDGRAQHGIRAEVRANGRGVFTVANAIQEYE